MSIDPHDRSQPGLWIICALASLMSAAVLIKSAWLGDIDPMPMLLTSLGVVVFGAIAMMERPSQRSR